ncbi:MAG: ABC transporter permease, partial [Pseudomonadota bacterium]
MFDLWYSLSPPMQDALVLAVLLLPVLLFGRVLTRGYTPAPLIRAILWRYRFSNAMFVLLIAVAVGLGAALLVHERGLRTGTAEAADNFDMIIAAPGSEVSMMLAAVYLQPTNAGLLDGEMYARIAEDPRVALAAPLAFGDSHEGAPIVGTTAEFLTVMSETLAEGHIWTEEPQAVIGIDVPMRMGEVFRPTHGFHTLTATVMHEDELVVVGRMNRTGTPWDRAIVVPVESVWTVHGIANGHAPDSPNQLGPPFDPEHFPGTPAIVVHGTSFGATYGLQTSFASSGETMAFFPGAVLASLFSVMGDIRQAMSLMALVTQFLVAAAVLLGFFILSQLFQRQMSLLRALGAPSRFIL